MADQNDDELRYCVPIELSTAVQRVLAQYRAARARVMADVLLRDCDSTSAAPVLDAFMRVESEITRQNDALEDRWLRVVQDAYVTGRREGQAAGCETSAISMGDSEVRNLLKADLPRH